MRLKSFLKEQKDIFGFDKEFAPSSQKINLDNDPPIDPINCEQILAELNRLTLGNKNPNWDWQDRITWGEHLGAVRAEVSPLGSYKFIIRKLANDLIGENIWICKNIYPLRECGFNQDEMNIAYSVFNILENINKELLDSPAGAFPHFKKLSHSLTTNLRIKAPDFFVFEETIEVNDHYTLNVFSARGQGDGAQGSRKIEEFHVHLAYDKTSGLIRSWGNEISSPKSGGRSWQPQPSEWDELFCPSQPIKEITSAIVNAFSTY